MSEDDYDMDELVAKIRLDTSEFEAYMAGIKLGLNMTSEEIDEELFREIVYDNYVKYKNGK